MSFVEFYDSFFQHPLLLWVAALGGLSLALSRPGLSDSARRFCIALTIVSLLDAWLTSNDVFGVGVLTGAAASVVPLVFVLVGDLRYFLFIEAAQADGTLRADAGAIGRACAWTLVVPLTSQGLVHALGADEPRILFLVYETLFVLLSIGIAVFYLPRRAHALDWTRRVTGFVILYYALWAVSDAIILSTGADIGFLLRILPNALYYGGLVPAIAWARESANPRNRLF